MGLPPLAGAVHAAVSFSLPAVSVTTGAAGRLSTAIASVPVNDSTSLSEASARAFVDGAV